MLSSLSLAVLSCGDAGVDDGDEHGECPAVSEFWNELWLAKKITIIASYASNDELDGQLVNKNSLQSQK